MCDSFDTITREEMRLVRGVRDETPPQTMLSPHEGQNSWTGDGSAWWASDDYIKEPWPPLA